MGANGLPIYYHTHATPPFPPPTTTVQPAPLYKTFNKYKTTANCRGYVDKTNEVVTDGCRAVDFLPVDRAIVGHFYTLPRHVPFNRSLSHVTANVFCTKHTLQQLTMPFPIRTILFRLAMQFMSGIATTLYTKRHVIDKTVTLRYNKIIILNRQTIGAGTMKGAKGSR